MLNPHCTHRAKGTSQTLMYVRLDAIFPLTLRSSGAHNSNTPAARRSMTYEEQLRARLEAVADRLRDGLLRDLDETLGGAASAGGRPGAPVEGGSSLRPCALAHRDPRYAGRLCHTRGPSGDAVACRGRPASRWRLSSFGPQVEPTDTFEGTSGLIAQAIRNRVPVSRTDGSRRIRRPVCWPARWIGGARGADRAWRRGRGRSLCRPRRPIWQGQIAVMLELLARHAARAPRMRSPRSNGAAIGGPTDRTLAAREQGSSDARQEPTERAIGAALCTAADFRNQALSRGGGPRGLSRARSGTTLRRRNRPCARAVPSSAFRRMSERTRPLPGGARANARQRRRDAPRRRRTIAAGSVCM